MHSGVFKARWCWISLAAYFHFDTHLIVPLASVLGVAQAAAPALRAFLVPLARPVMALSLSRARPTGRDTSHP
eukprot:6198549-Pleurochrysis_carterae.AAC.8